MKHWPFKPEIGTKEHGTKRPSTSYASAATEQGSANTFPDLRFSSQSVPQSYKESRGQTTQKYIIRMFNYNTSQPWDFVFLELFFL
jgi:hypothetical protein